MENLSIPREAEPPSGERGPVSQQRSTVRVFKHALRAEVTPVFGTGAPPRGLSGMIRHWAYRIPEHKVGHLMALMLADRVDVWEHIYLPKVPFAAVVLLAAGIAARKLLVRRQALTFAPGAPSPRPRRRPGTSRSTGGGRAG